jgi:hypothetical protein
MLVRTPLIPVTLLALVVAALALPGDPTGLLLLTPALALVLPLLLGRYPGETSVARLSSWFARAVSPQPSRHVPALASAGFSFCLNTGFRGERAGRGPPAFG